MPKAAQKSVTLLLGGARSGKSRHALELAASHERVVFIATALASDGEMADKILRHQQERPPEWKTVEVSTELAQALLAQSAQTDVIIVDCLTLFASSLLDRSFSMSESNGKDAGRVWLDERITELCNALEETSAAVVLVTNEVGSGIVPAFPAGRLFRDVLGQLNQRVAAVADTVLLMVAGLPLTVKSPHMESRS